MLMAISWLTSSKMHRTESHTYPTSERFRVRPMLEELEPREVPDATPVSNPLNALLGSNPGLVPINFNYISNQGGALSAVGQMGANAVSVPLTLTAAQSATDPSAEILSLHLSPIHLDVLGLNVQTSDICLNITAQQGSGDLLGNLLYGLAHALDPNGGGQSASQALSSQGPVQNLLDSLVLATLLNGGVNDATAASSLSNTSNATGLPPGATDLVHLSVGPVNLNLLGLNVALNNCANPQGPVVVDVYTVPGSGELLGNLLTDVANALNPNQNNLQAEHLLGNAVNTILTAV
jgi:hypothetical protein